MKARTLLIGFAAAVILRLIFPASSLPVFIGVIAAATLDREVNWLRGLSYGLIIGFSYGLFIGLVYRDASLSWLLLGQVMVSVMGGLAGLAAGTVMGVLRKRRTALNCKS